jgi:hypothetical protein
MVVGRKETMLEGRKEGNNDGRKEGTFDDGKKEGIKETMIEGRKEGGKLTMITRMPRSAKTLTVSWPIPVFAPVTMPTWRKGRRKQ